MYLALNEDISFSWGDHTVAPGLPERRPAEGAVVFGSFRLTAAPHQETAEPALGFAVQFLRGAADVMSPCPGFFGSVAPSSIAVGDQDVVSEAALITHLAASPARLSFLAEQVPSALPATAVTVTGAAFAEASFGPASAGIFASGDFIMTFVDDRFGGFLNFNRPTGMASSRFTAADPGAIVLADNTTIRLTGLMQGWARQAIGSLNAPSAAFGLPGACFAG